jgi:hypothetical protein
MPNDLKEEMAIAPGMESLALGWPSQGNTTNNKRPRTKSKFLFPMVTLLANELNRF